MGEAWFSQVVGGYELSVVKAADQSHDTYGAVSGAIGIVVMVLTHGCFGWGPSLDEPRWVVRVGRGGDTEEVKNVRTTFTRRGATRAARRIRKTLSSGDAQAFEALPDYLV